MSAPAAIAGTFSDYRLVKSRSVLQLVVEVSVERQAEVFAALGYPLPGADIHVALARLVAPADETRPQDAAVPVSSRSEQGKARYASATERQQAVIRAARYPKDARFRAWVADIAGDESLSEHSTAEFVRGYCNIISRSDIEHNDEAYDKFLGLEAAYKQAAGLMAEAR